jgi:hypothetical protein
VGWPRQLLQILRMAALQGAMLKKHMGPGCAQVPPSGSGSLVFRIDPLAPAAEVLQEHDVVMEIEASRFSALL